MAENNTPLNIEKVVSFIKEDIFSKGVSLPVYRRSNCFGNSQKVT